jgi:hypothetical protein
MAIKVANNQSMTGITALPSSISGGAWTLLSTTTASSSATLSITSGLDSTYDVYCFKFIDMHPATDNVNFQFNMSIDTGSNYNVTKTTTAFFGNGAESDSGQQLAYSAGGDLAQGTGFQNLTDTVGNDADASCTGTLYLFSPSNTTFVKHFLSRVTCYWSGNGPIDWFAAGYGNTTSAVDAVQFKMSSGNTDAGVIKLYGIS